VLDCFGLEGNFALTQVEGRRFPGLLIQGDTLQSLQVSIRELEAAIQTQDGEWLQLRWRR